MSDSDLGGLSESDTEQATNTETQMLPGDSPKQDGDDQDSQIATQQLPSASQAAVDDEEEEDEFNQKQNKKHKKMEVDSDDEGEEDAMPKKKSKKSEEIRGGGGKKKNSTSKFFDDEADESDDGKGKGDGEDDDDENGKDDNDNNDYEDDGFVVRDEEDDDDDDGDDGDDGLDTSEDDEPTNKRLKKKKRGRGSDMEDFDEDDLEIAGFSRNEEKAATTSGYDSNEDNEGGSGGGGNAVKAKSTKELQDKLFGDEDDDDEESGENDSSGEGGDKEESGKQQPKAVVSKRPVYGEEGYDSMEDFIDRDGDEEESDDDEEEQGVSRRVRAPLVTAEDSLALRDAHDIFGVDLAELDDLAFGMDSEDEDDEQGTVGLSKATRNLNSLYEPAVRAANLVTEEADFIRSMPIPERLYHLKERPDIDAQDRLTEAKHIAMHLMSHHRRCKLDDLVGTFPATLNDQNIEKAVLRVLELIHEGHEVPFIEVYRPDEYQPYLTRRDLWRVYDLDGKFDAMQERRRRLSETAAKLREHMPSITPTSSSASSSSSSDISTPESLALAAASRRAAEIAKKNAVEAQQHALEALQQAQSLKEAEQASPSKEGREEEDEEEKKDTNEDGGEATDSTTAEGTATGTVVSAAALQELEAAVAATSAEVETANSEWEEAKAKEEAIKQSTAKSDDSSDNDSEEDSDDVGLESTDESNASDESDGFGDGSDDDSDDEEKRLKEKRKLLRKQRREERKNKLALKQKSKEEKRARKDRKKRMLERGIEGPSLLDIPSSLDDIWQFSSNENELDDVQIYMRLMQEGVLGSFGIQEEKRRRHPRSNSLNFDLYRRCVAYNLKPLARQFMCAIPELGEAMQNGGVVLPPTPKQTPLELAAKYVKRDMPEIDTPKRVLKAVRSMMAMEMSCEPRIKKQIRQIYEGSKEFDRHGRGRHSYGGATLSTQVTLQGKKKIDMFEDNRYHGIQRIHRKPCMLILEECAMASEREEESEDAASHTNGGVSLLSTNSSPENDPNDIRYHTHHAQYRQSLFFRVLDAAKEGFLSYKIEPPKPPSRYGDDLYGEFRAPFENAGALVAVSNGNEAMEAWNGLRLQVLEEAIKLRLIPCFKAEMERKLRKATKQAIIDGSVNQFKKKYLDVGPYQPKHLTPMDLLCGSGNSVKVVAVCVSENRQFGDAFVALTDHGAVRDTMSFAPGMPRDRSRSQIEDFLFAHQPHVIVISTSAGRQSKSMLDFLQELSKSVVEKKKEQIKRMRESDGYEDEEVFDDDEENEAEVFLLPDTLADIFSKSPRAHDEFPHYQSQNLKKAVSLGRFVQEPLAEVSYLWSRSKSNSTGRRGEEALFLNLHPFADKIAKPSILEALERELINSVCDCGVNLNAAVLNVHRQPMLSFVCGLGLVKAQDLVSKIKKMKHSQVAKRAALRPILIGKVFNNAAGFLRIRDFPLVYLNPIEDTRIHPETYLEHQWVRTMVEESCGDDNEAQRLLRRLTDEGDEEDWGELAKLCIDRHKDAFLTASQAAQGESATIDWANWSPREVWNCQEADDFGVDDNLLQDKLGDLDLEAYAATVEAGLEEQNNMMKVHRKIQHIKNEIRFPFHDRRNPFRGPNLIETYEAITQDSPSSLIVGSRLHVRVKRLDGRWGLTVHVDSFPTMMGSISKQELGDRELSEDRYLEESKLEEKFPLGTVLIASLVSVDIERMKIHLSLDRDRLDFVRPDFLDLLETENCGAMPNTIAYLPYIDEFLQRKKVADDYQDNCRRVVQPADSKRQMANRNAYTRVFHPNFVKNISEERHEKLKSNVGGFVITPKKDKGLNLLWAFQKNMIKPFTITELEKKNEQELGNKLSIAYGVNGSQSRPEVYESIEEVEARFVGAMNDLVQEVTGNTVTGEKAHKKFVRGSAAEAVAEIQSRVIPRGNEKSCYGVHVGTCPNGIPEDTPGWFTVTMQSAHKQPKHVSVRVTPDGFVYNGRNHDTFQQCLHYLQKHVTQPAAPHQHQHHQQQQQTAPRSAGAKRHRFGDSIPSSANSQAPPPPPPPQHVPAPPPAAHLVPPLPSLYPPQGYPHHQQPPPPMEYQQPPPPPGHFPPSQGGQFYPQSNQETGGALGAALAMVGNSTGMAGRSSYSLPPPPGGVPPPPPLGSVPPPPPMSRQGSMGRRSNKPAWMEDQNNQ